MRAVTEPYGPPALDAGFPSSRVTEERALDTCAVDRAAIDAALADAGDDCAYASDEASDESQIAALDPTVTGAAPLSCRLPVPPAWAQLLRLEVLLHEWMSANPACDRLLVAELRRQEAFPIVVAEVARRTKPTTATGAGGGDYVAKLANQLIRRRA